MIISDSVPDPLGILVVHRSFIRAGLDVKHVIHEVEKHLQGLLALPDTTPDKEVAKQTLEEYISFLSRVSTDKH